MTIAELTVAFLIMAIIIGPLSATVLLGLKSTQQTIHRTTDTTDQQILASYFTPDVQSADTVQTGSTCGASLGTPVLQLRWTDPGEAAASSVKVASYVMTSGNELHRVFCQGDATTQAQVKVVPVVHALVAAPTVTCDGATCPASAAATAPRDVAVHVSTKGSATGASFDQYDFDLSATRRVTA